MGKGRFIGTGLDLYVSFDIDTSAVEDQVEDLLSKLAERFFQATDGQLSISNIFWIDNGLGRNIADNFFRADPNSGILGQALLEGLGDYGAWSAIFGVDALDPTRNDELASITMHELGHYIWGLGDEYAGPILPGPIAMDAQQIYESGNAPPYRRVYLSPAFDIINPVLNAPYNLLDCEVQVLLGDIWVPNFADQVNVLPGGIIELVCSSGQGFPTPPSATDADVRVRPAAICGVSGEDYCLMNGRGGDVGRHEFCGLANHDPSKSTMQSVRHDGLACWEVVADKMSQSWSVVVAPQLLGDSATGAAPNANVQKLSAEVRHVLVFDRSGSMEENEKIEGARAGLERWLDFANNNNDRIGIVWFNSLIDPVLSINNIALIGNLDQIKQSVTGLPPEGATNIKDALDQGADMLIAEAQTRGPALQQCIVLMTDGEHNVPPPSAVALDAVAKCQENGIQIFTLGLGDSNTVDTTVLEQLAYQTSGRPVMDALGETGEDQVQSVQTALLRLRQELWGNVAADTVLDIDELLSSSSPLDELIRKAKADGSRPSFDRLMDAAGASSLSELLKNKARFASTSMWVEKGATGADFNISFPRKQPAWLYLIDPDDKVLSEAEMKPFAGRGVYEGSIIKKPKRGRWTVVAVRQELGPAFRARFIGGIENRSLVAWGDCDKIVPTGTSARLRARANWDGDLSGLSVRALLTDPQGGKHTVVLNDETAEDPFSGTYQGTFTPTINGRHEGEIIIAGEEQILLGGGIEALSHMSDEARKEGAGLDLRRKRDRFIRRIKIYFDAGERRPPQDREKITGIWAKDRSRRRRPAKAKAAL